MGNQFLSREKTLRDQANCFLPGRPATGETEIITEGFKDPTIIKDRDLFPTRNSDGADPSIFFLGLLHEWKIGEIRPFSGSKERLTYHDPCHLRRGMKVYQEPRELLESLPGIDFVEMKKPDRCCGMAGSFNFIYYDLFQKILQHKLNDIEGTKADYVVTSCMGCMIQLQDGIHQRKMGTRVIHLIEAIEVKGSHGSES
jgi:Fe-S oxidoreductase